MLVIEPLRRIAVRQSEITFGTKPPQYIAGSGAVGIINLENPTLVPHGQE